MMADSPKGGRIARARSVLEAAQSDLHTIQMKLAPLRMQERRALAKVAEAAQALRVLEGGGEPGRVCELALVQLARLYEGRPCDTDAGPSGPAYGRSEASPRSTARPCDTEEPAA